MNPKSVVLAGNPNVGKSTVFNGLTGMKQHTGNWTGKTVTTAKGEFKVHGQTFQIIDLPGTYSLSVLTQDERVASEYLYYGQYDVVVVVCDATCLERNLYLVQQIMEVSSHVIVCLNLMDEAERKHIDVDTIRLEELLGVPVVTTSARKRQSLRQLTEIIYQKTKNEEQDCKRWEILSPEERIKKSEMICQQVIVFHDEEYNRRDRKWDKLLTSRKTGIPIMLLMITLIFWITMKGANVPSRLLFEILFWLGDKIKTGLEWVSAPQWLIGALIDGIYRVLAWVVAVMLPPMAIFFPLFTLLEDFGYLPRVAFNLDRYFQKSCACGKQALTMCMGFGCNAVGVTGCRIIDSPRERLIAIITNNFVPCNGRFPTLITIITIFFAGLLSSFQGAVAAIVLTMVIVLGVVLTFLISRILSGTILKGIPSNFALELPPYRMPQVGKVIVHSIFDRTLFVLGRAVIVAAPAGLLIWCMANIQVDNASLLFHCSYFLDPFARLMGLDGVILLAFILGFPANEIVIPIIIMAYLNKGSILELDNLMELKILLVENGWTVWTAVSMILFTLIHWPCSTTCLTVKKETGSLKWTALSIFIPTVTGILVCVCFTAVSRLFLYT